MARTATKPNAELAYLLRAMKAPALAAAIGGLRERARSEGWTHEEFLAANRVSPARVWGLRRGR